MSFLGDVGGWVANPVSNFANGAVNTIFGGGGGGGIFGGLGNFGGDIAGQITGPISEAIGRISAPIAQGITSGFQSAYDNSKNKWKTDQLNKIPNIEEAKYPGFQSLLQGNQLPGQFQLNPNMDALTQARQFATQQGPTPWAQMQTQNIGGALPGQQAFSSSQIGGANTMAKQGLMAEGGLSQGASNRLDKRAGFAQMMANQDLTQKSMMDKQAIGTADEEQKAGLLQALPGLENTALAPQQYNIQKTLEEHQAGNQAELERYKQAMNSWATGKTGQAIASSGKK